jgi:glycosyltransferase involved in cell wall biosynthesis
MAELNKKLKTAFFFPSLDIGGVEKVMITLANEFISRGFLVDIVVCSKKGELISELNNKVRIIDFGGIRLAFSFWKLYLYFLREKPYSVISGPTYPNLISIIVSKFCKNPPITIITHHNFHDLEIKSLGFRGKIIPYLIKTFYNYASSIVAVSNGILDDLTLNFSIKKNLINRIYNPVLNDFFYKKSMEAFELPFSIESKNLIVSIGRMENIKNFDLMIEAFFILKKQSRLGQKKLILIGAGREFKRLKQKVKDLGLNSNIHFTDSLINPLPILKKASLFIQTSFQESFSIVIVEALALGVKVITTKTSGALEILGDNYEGFVNFNDAENLADKIEAMIDSSYVIKNKIDVTRYGISHVSNQYSELIFST